MPGGLRSSGPRIGFEGERIGHPARRPAAGRRASDEVGVGVGDRRVADSRPSGRYQATRPLSGGQDDRRRSAAGSTAREGPAPTPSLDGRAEAAPRRRRAGARCSSRRSRSSARHSWTKTLARSMSSVTTPTCARTSEIELDPGPKTTARRDRRPRPRRRRPRSGPRCRSTIDHRTSCFEATCAYRLAPWMSTRAGDVAHARRRVAVLVEQRAGGVLDLAPARGLDHRLTRPPN